MAIEVDYITLGDVAERLDTPAPTLRNWTDQLEEFNVHYVLRNNRNERIYEDTDIAIFQYLKDMKVEHGRKTTTRDLAYMIANKGRSGEFKLRSREDAPIEPSNRTADLLNHEDIKQVLQSERVRQIIQVIVDETNSKLDERVRLAVREELAAERERSGLLIEQQATERESEQAKIIEELQQKVEELTREKDQPKGFFKKLFG